MSIRYFCFPFSDCGCILNLMKNIAKNRQYQLSLKSIQREIEYFTIFLSDKCNSFDTPKNIICLPCLKFLLN